MNTFQQKAENVVGPAMRYSSRIKIESPSVAALAKRTNQDSRDTSPSTVCGDDEPVCKTEPEFDSGQSINLLAAKLSPSKSSITKSSPTKSVASYKTSKL